MKHICHLLLLCLLVVIPGLDAQANEKDRSEVNLGWVDVLESDRGWKVQNARQSGNWKLFEDGDLILKVGQSDVSRLGPLSTAALLSYAQTHNLRVVIERAGQQQEFSLSAHPGPDPADRMRGRYGIGASFSSHQDPHKIVVIGVVPGSPAEQAGLKKGDELIAVDAKPVGDLPISAVVDLITITHEAPAQLSIRRAVDEFDVTVQRVPLEQVFKLPPPGAIPFPLHPRGENAPPFVLPDITGRSRSLGEFTGKPVIITFWGTWCGPCVQETGVLNKLAQEFGHRLVILGLDVNDEPDVLQKFLQKRPLSYTIVNAGKSDAPVPATYDVVAIPLTLVITSDGSISYVESGYASEGLLESHVRSLMGK